MFVLLLVLLVCLWRALGKVARAKCDERGGKDRTLAQWSVIIRVIVRDLRQKAGAWGG